MPCIIVSWPQKTQTHNSSTLEEYRHNKKKNTHTMAVSFSAAKFTSRRRKVGWVHAVDSSSAESTTRGQSEEAWGEAVDAADRASLTLSPCSLGWWVGQEGRPSRSLQRSAFTVPTVTFLPTHQCFLFSSSDVTTFTLSHFCKRNNAHLVTS